MPKLFLVLIECVVCGCFAYWLASVCFSAVVHSVSRWQLFVSIKCVFCAVPADSSNLPCRSTQTSNKSRRMRRDGEERAYWERQNRRSGPFSAARIFLWGKDMRQNWACRTNTLHALFLRSIVIDFRVSIMRIACTSAIMYVACPSEAEVWCVCVCGPYVWVLIVCGFVCLRGR